MFHLNFCQSSKTLLVNIIVINMLPIKNDRLFTYGLGLKVMARVYVHSTYNQSLSNIYASWSLGCDQSIVSVPLFKL